MIHITNWKKKQIHFLKMLWSAMPRSVELANLFVVFFTWFAFKPAITKNYIFCVGFRYDGNRI